MSGRWLTVIALTGCLLMVAFALWKRSRTTEHVREFWGPSQASLIQHSSNVKLRGARTDAPWQDISQAPGLVHLRATLVDDRYFRWNAVEPAQLPENHYVLQFTTDGQTIELSIAPETGVVTNLQRQQSVPLIPASRQAVAAYLQQIADE